MATMSRGEKALTVRQQARQGLIRKMLAMGLSRTEIHASLQDKYPSSQRTVDRDIAEIAQLDADETTNLTAAKLGAMLQRNHFARIRELWTVVLNATANKTANWSKVRIEALREIRAHEESMVKSMQQLGIVYRAPIAVDLQTKALHILEYRIPRDARMELALAKTADEVRGVLMAHVGAEDAELVIKAAAMRADGPIEE